MSQHVRISEIFGPTIQGEGPLIGRPSVFVRTGGCDYRCSWCDTLYAVLPEYRDEWQPMTASEIMARVNRLSRNQPLLVSLSGGNPALQPLQPLIRLGRGSGHTFALETQGTVAQPWFAELDWLILSPKAPSSNMAMNWVAFEACLRAAKDRPRSALKIVVFDDADYDFARAVAARYQNLPTYLQVGNPAPLIGADAVAPDQANISDLLDRFRWLADRVLADGWFSATVLPQLHVLAWGNARGV